MSTFFGVSRNWLSTLFKNLARGEHGATSVEYAVALAAIFLAVIATVVIVGSSLNGSFGNSGGSINNYFAP